MNGEKEKRLFFVMVLSHFDQAHLELQNSYAEERHLIPFFYSENERTNNMLDSIPAKWDLIKRKKK